MRTKMVPSGCFKVSSTRPPESGEDVCGKASLLFPHYLGCDWGRFLEWWPAPFLAQSRFSARTAGTGLLEWQCEWMNPSPHIERSVVAGRKQHSSKNQSAIKRTQQSSKQQSVQVIKWQKPASKRSRHTSTNSKLENNKLEKQTGNSKLNSE